ncbi:beta-galactosidase [Curtobacterium sp. MCBD17_013]|uniref:glycoside hydrolase family 35 protein n=1 Tax=Curtobacterium sp. MCBD17_013 TaxID=2175668 RepID=UPI000DA9BECC|nr:beta-galactosidase [Curtobacterium sp. MCBD17_013]PZF60018.1 beta-galactosidase [Curtobacterium sp. MCBD17_013]
MRFAIGPDDFLLDGEPHRVLSGALHYFRVHPDQWADRIHKARLMGLNTIETYVAWNAHAPSPDTFDLTGGLDLGRFLDLVAAEGMHAIVRPGPYICAEWANGGLPSWLFADANVGVRRNEPRFLAAVQAYLERLAPVLVPRQIDAGGPIVLVQVENEYGAYGSDPAYLRALLAMHRDIGLTVPFTSVDQPMGTMLEDGTIPGLHATGSFGSRASERLATLRGVQPTGPLMCSEFWDGWFDSWGEHHHTTSATDSARELDALLAAGASVNVYMFHGGTNYGLTNGANDKGVYRPIATSYDYDAPLDEAGLPTPKFHAFRSVIERYAPVPDLPPEFAPDAPAPAPVPDVAIRFDRALSLWSTVDDIATWTHHDDVPTVDALGSGAGFVLYRTEVDLPAGGVLTVEEVRDRAQVFLDGRPVGVLEREHHDHALVLPPVGRAVLDVLVEDQGRVDYGVRIGEPKGLVGPVTVDGVPLARWSVTPLDLVAAVAGSADGREARHASVPQPAPAVPAAVASLGHHPSDGAAKPAAVSPAAEPAADVPPVADSPLGEHMTEGAVLTAPAPALPVVAALRDARPDPAPTLAGPTFALATVELDAVRDLHLALDGFGKGVAWVNGFCLGRYWSRGPQRTLYVPAPVVRAGRNEVVVFELGAAARRDAVFRGSADLGHTEA